MKTKLNKALIMISFSIFTFNVLSMNGLSLEKKAGVNYYNKEQPEQLLITLNNGNIVLTAALDSGHYSYSNFKLKIGSKEKSFDWRSLGDVKFLPSMKLIDLGNDKNAGVVIFLLEAKGTGIFIQRVHIFRISDFKEITVENPLRIVESHVKIQGSHNSIIVNIDGKKLELDKSYLDKQGIRNPNVKLYFDNHIVYGIINNNLSAEVGVCDENLIYIGSINIEYTYKNEMLTMNKISFQKF
jgi:hypothetical protein